MEPAPPPITIVDPNAPAGFQELIAGGGDGWRPTRRQKLVVAMTALIVALLAGGIAELRHVHHERALDAAAVADVSLAVQAPRDYWGGDQGLLLLNGGKLSVHLMSAALVGVGYAERDQDVDVLSGATAEVSLSTAKNCRAAMYTEQAQQLRVRVRTSRGAVVSRVLDLPDELADGIGRTERERCDFLRPEEAFGSSVIAAERHGRDIVVSFDVSNGGLEPLTVTSLAGAPGLSASAKLPLTLPRRTFWTGASHVQFEVTVRVTDCATFAESSHIDTESPDITFEGALLESPLRVDLKNPYVTGQGALWLASYDGDWEPGGPPHVDVAALLSGTCPARLFPRRPVEISLQ